MILGGQDDGGGAKRGRQPEQPRSGSLVKSPYSVLEGRPLWVQQGTGRTALFIHDNNYLQQKREWMELLKRTHPDTAPGVGPSTFQQVLKGYRSWEGRQTKFYGNLGTEKPRLGQLRRVPNEVEIESPLKTLARLRKTKPGTYPGGKGAL